MKHAEWTAPAKIDLQNLYLWHLDYDLATADRFVRAVVAKCDWLALNPLIGSPLDRSRRKSLVVGTSYLVIYRPATDGITVLRIYHQSQNWR